LINHGWPGFAQVGGPVQESCISADYLISRARALTGYNTLWFADHLECIWQVAGIREGS